MQTYRQREKLERAVAVVRDAAVEPAVNRGDAEKYAPVARVCRDDAA